MAVYLTLYLFTCIYLQEKGRGGSSVSVYEGGEGGTKKTGRGEQERGGQAEEENLRNKGEVILNDMHTI